MAEKGVALKGVIIGTDGPFQVKYVDTFNPEAKSATNPANLELNLGTGTYCSSVVRLFSIVETIYGCKKQVRLRLSYLRAAAGCWKM